MALPQRHSGRSAFDRMVCHKGIYMHVGNLACDGDGDGDGRWRKDRTAAFSVNEVLSESNI
jgi:hypothetical protein